MLQSLSSTPSVEIVSSLGLVGGMKGYGFLLFSQRNALLFTSTVSRALGYAIEGEELTELHRSFLLEFTNQIFGRTAGKFSRLGIDVRITPPSLLLGKGVSPLFFHEAAHLHLSIQGTFGTFLLSLILKHPLR
ncbi:CheC domain protein [Spirochaeta thermophila DSM 6578]|uniref:CheC domain protein n=1 Tax=Winmispira thermophila (strain ATCC 700085 / DSM 6578 / Z-1203) TaxID=869211 RepID=G0GDI5_WINT7|nr:CheC domain protein [Spirochaeta thermophila DSM 6578]